MSGVEQWRLLFPYNSDDLFSLPPFFQLNAAGSMLFAQHLLGTDTVDCVEMWGVAIGKSAAKVAWKVSRCFPPIGADLELTFPGGLLFPGALREGDDVDDIVLLLPGSFALGKNGNVSDILPWTSIAASTGRVLHEEVLPLAPLSLFSSLQSGGCYFSVQGLNISGNWSAVIAVLSMSTGGVFGLQSSRTYDGRYTLSAVTTSDTLMQGFVDSSNGSVSSWVGWTVPEQRQRWRRSDDAILMGQWPTQDANAVWLYIADHPLNSSWSVATTLGAEGGGIVWAIVAIFESHTGDRIATSQQLGPQAADDEGDVYPRPARLIHTDQGPRLLQTLQEGVYVLDVNTLALQYAGKAAKNDMNPYVLWMEGSAASRLRVGHDSFGGSTMTLNATSAVQTNEAGSRRGRKGPRG